MDNLSPSHPNLSLPSTPQIDDAGAVEAARAARQEAIRAALAGGGGKVLDTAATEEGERKLAADFYTQVRRCFQGAGASGAGSGGARAREPPSPAAAVPGRGFLRCRRFGRTDALHSLWGRVGPGCRRWAVGMQVEGMPAAPRLPWPCACQPRLPWPCACQPRLPWPCACQPRLPWPRACQPRLPWALPPPSPQEEMAKFAKPRKKKERRLKKKGITAEELAALEAEAAAAEGGGRGDLGSREARAQRAADKAAALAAAEAERRSRFDAALSRANYASLALRPEAAADGAGADEEGVAPEDEDLYASLNKWAWGPGRRAVG